MRHKIVSISTAKAKLLEHARKVFEEGFAYIITKDGEAVAALVPLEDYEALLETADVGSNDQLMNDLNEALDDEKHGRLWKRNKDGRWSKAKGRKKSA
jgi:prevent-host-death family protein